MSNSHYQLVADLNPFEFGVVGESVNEYGTPVSVVRCIDCGTVVTVCPVTTTERWGYGCLADDCPSYELERDIDIFFEPMVEHGLIHRESQT